MKNKTLKPEYERLLEKAADKGYDTETLKKAIAYFGEMPDNDIEHDQELREYINDACEDTDINITEIE